MKRELLIKRLRRGWLSSAEAFIEFGSIKLSSRISELRASGVNVISREASNGRKRWFEYRIAR